MANFWSTARLVIAYLLCILQTGQPGSEISVEIQHHGFLAAIESYLAIAFVNKIGKSHQSIQFQKIVFVHRVFIGVDPLPVFQLEFFTQNLIALFSES
jgi:hypothetical protein